MGAGAVAAREGAYTTWAIQAIYDTGVAISGNDNLGIRNNGNVYWHDQGAYTAYIISPAANLLATLDGSLAKTGYGRVASLADKYILLVKWDDTKLLSLVVQEGLTELWERDVNGDAGGYTLEPDAPGPVDPDLVAISPSGEWIAAIVKEKTTENGLLFIYKGSSPL